MFTCLFVFICSCRLSTAVFLREVKLTPLELLFVFLELLAIGVVCNGKCPFKSSAQLPLYHFFVIIVVTVFCNLSDVQILIVFPISLGCCWGSIPHSSEHLTWMFAFPCRSFTYDSPHICFCGCCLWFGDLITSILAIALFPSRSFTISHFTFRFVPISLNSYSWEYCAVMGCAPHLLPVRAKAQENPEQREVCYPQICRWGVGLRARSWWRAWATLAEDLGLVSSAT